MKSKNQRAHELRGLCWHEVTKPAPFKNGYFLCEKCGRNVSSLGGRDYENSIAYAWELVKDMEKDGYRLILKKLFKWSAEFAYQSDIESSGNFAGVSFTPACNADTASEAILDAYLKAKGIEHA